MNAVMTHQNLIDTISEILKVPPTDLTPDSALGVTPGWDSMAHVDIMMVLEDRLGIEISEESLESLTTLGSILHLLEEN